MAVSAGKRDDRGGAEQYQAAVNKVLDKRFLELEQADRRRQREALKAALDCPDDQAWLDWARKATPLADWGTAHEPKRRKAAVEPTMLGTPKEREAALTQALDCEYKKYLDCARQLNEEKEKSKRLAGLIETYQKELHHFQGSNDPRLIRQNLEISRLSETIDKDREKLAAVVAQCNEYQRLWTEAAESVDPIYEWRAALTFVIGGLLLGAGITMLVMA